ncbi:MAG: dNTP triphosphohydrolase [Phycisphaerae bacterium]
MHHEPDDPLRNPFEFDRHRIIESTSFRRLEGKTQVFAPSHHDHFRTRLTHTLEATQIARCLATALQANESLAEAITLGHDLGHPPFGHTGEAALDEAMTAHGGFNHNAHSLRVVEYLEHPFPTFRGLNLTGETRAGLTTHVTRYDTPGSTADGSDGSKPRAAGFSPRGAADTDASTSRRSSQNDRPTAPSVEAQIASVADRIAYNCHDLEDAIGAGFLGLEELRNVALWESAYEKTAAESHVRHIHAIRRVVLDTMLDALLMDVIQTSRQHLEPIESFDEVIRSTHALVTLSSTFDARLTKLERFLIEHVYQHSEVAVMDARGRKMVHTLFDAYHANPDALPDRFAARIEEQGVDRVICDYIAGMTDRFCTAEHDRLVPPHNQSGGFPPAARRPK